MSVALIWAQARGGVIGRDGDIPWHVPEDQVNFRRLTRGRAVIMGRATWDSLPDRFRPLPDRLNVVLTRDPSWAAEGATVVHTPHDALVAAGVVPDRLRMDAREDSGGQETWVMGGGAVYAAFLPVADRLVVTEIDLDVPGDTCAPPIGPDWVLGPDQGPDDGWRESRTGTRYRILTYRRRVPADGGDAEARESPATL